MSRPSAVLCGVFALGLVVALAFGAGTERRMAFTLGVTPAGAVAELEPGQQACQAPIAVPDSDAAFDRVVVALGTYGRPGPAVSVIVADNRTRVPVAAGALAGGYGDIGREPTHAIALDRRVQARSPLTVCIGNDGKTRLAVYGNGAQASRTSSATIGGQPAGVDLSLGFERAEPRSTLSLVPAMLERASLWRASWIGSWLYVLLALVVVVAVPALLVAAVRDAART